MAENTQDEMPSRQPEVAPDELHLSEVAVKSLQDQDHSQEEKESTRMMTTSINCFHMLRSREICCTGKREKLPNIFRGLLFTSV